MFNPLCSFVESSFQPFHPTSKQTKRLPYTSNEKQHHNINKFQSYFSNDNIINKNLNNDEKNAFYNSITNNINKHLFNNNLRENEFRFFSSPKSKDKNINHSNMYYAYGVRTKQHKNNNKKNSYHIDNVFGFENLPQNRYYIEKERKKRERRNRFDGLIVVKQITQKHINEAQMRYNESNHKLNLQVENNNCERNNKNVYHRNSYVNNIWNANSNNSLTNIKINNMLSRNVLEEQKRKVDNVFHNYYTISDKRISTCENISRSQNNGLILGIQSPIQNMKIFSNNIYDRDNIKKAKSLEFQNIKSNDKVINKSNNKNIDHNRNDLLKQSFSFGNCTQYQSPQLKNENLNNNNIHKYSNHQHYNSQLNINSTKNKTKTQFPISQSSNLNKSPSSNNIIASSPKNQEPYPTNSKKSHEKQPINFKDLNNFLYIIVPGNASYLVKHCMFHRINWKETFSSSSTLFNFKWQQLSHGIDFSSLSHISNLRQIVNHYEYHTLISHKANMFANLFKWCEDRNISIFKYVPFTIVHKLLKEDKDNSNKLKQERLEEFITSDIERYVKQYNQIGITRSYDPPETYGDIFPWLQPSNKRKEGERGGDELSKGKKERKVINKEEIVGKKTRVEIPDTHWKGKNMWLIKAANLNRGQCIRMVDCYEKMEKVIKMIQEGVEKDFTVAEIEGNEDKAGVNEKGNEKKKYSSNKIIIQKYIESPLLYKGRKCDIRLWVLITHKMRVYVFKEGHFKTCSVDYNINSQDAFTHITNYSFQKYSDNFAKFEIGNEVPFHDFQKFINEQYPHKHYSIKNNLMQQVKEIVTITMKCAKGQININKRKYSFEIFGYDFMLDSEFNLFLIEINTNPGLEESSPWIKKIVPRMLDDALRLTIDVLFNTKYDHSLNYKKEESDKEHNAMMNGKGGLVEIIKEDVLEKKDDVKDLEVIKLQNDKNGKDDNLIINEKISEQEDEDKDKKYVSPFPIPGYMNDENLWDFVCDLNEKDEYELKLEEIEKQKIMKKEKARDAFYTGIKHLMQKRNTRKTKS